MGASHREQRDQPASSPDSPCKSDASYQLRYREMCKHAIDVVLQFNKRILDRAGAMDDAILRGLGFALNDFHRGRAFDRIDNKGNGNRTWVAVQRVAAMCPLVGYDKAFLR